jgi:hypothetical protein
LVETATASLLDGTFGTPCHVFLSLSHDTPLDIPQSSQTHMKLLRVFAQLHQSRIWWYVIMINDDRKKTGESQGADKTARITVAIIDMLLRTIVLFLFSSTEYLNKCYQSLNVWRVKIHYANYFESEVGSLCRHKYLHFRLGTIEWHKRTTDMLSEWHKSTTDKLHACPATELFQLNSYG